MREEYNRSDLGEGIRGKYYQSAQADTKLVKLDPEVARAFPTEKAVNEALLALIRLAKQSKAMP